MSSTRSFVRSADGPLTLWQVLDVISQRSPPAAELQHPRQHADIHVDRAIRDAGVVTDAIRKGCLKEPAVRRLLFGDRLASRDIDDVAAMRLQQACDIYGIVRTDPARSPVHGADARAHRFFRRPYGAARVEDFERKTHPVVERAAV